MGQNCFDTERISKMPEKFYQAFVDQIGNEKLTRSINNIKQTAAAIWTQDVRIIRGFTGHGPEHSERIFEKLHKILWPDNAINLLSDYELYILILGVILHDIGMQCDVKKFPEIKAVAVNQFGASFQVDFSKGVASSYSIEEQNELRKNHHLLTAAWLDCIFRNENPLLPTIALDSVPTELREDLIDVCRFHSKLNILDCPERNDITQVRTRFIAALLRLGDELDIDRFRVDINTVKLFGYDIENSFFWYLHAYTVVNIENHLITLNVLLNKKDYDAFADYFKEKVIDEFQKKNGSLIEIIMSNGIAIGISRKSQVVYKRYQKSLPIEVCDYINKNTEKKDRNAKNQNSDDHEDTSKKHWTFESQYRNDSSNSVKEPFDSKGIRSKTRIEVANDVFTSERMNRWGSDLLFSYRAILELINKELDPASSVSLYMNLSLVDDSIIAAVTGLNKIMNESNITGKEPDRTTIVAYIMYWFLRRRPIQIICPPGKWIEDVNVKKLPSYSDNEFNEASQELARKIKYINEYTAVTFALSNLIDYDKLCSAEEDFRKLKEIQGKTIPYDSINEMVDAIVEKLLDMVSIRQFNVKNIVDVLKEYTNLLPSSVLLE